jgi:hypothetical protein
VEPVRPQEIVCKIDDDGVGGGVVDQGHDYAFHGMSAQNVALDKENYPNARSERWFAVAERAKLGNLSLARLPAEVRIELKRQAMAPTWKVDALGRRVVEPKDDTRETLGRSPDGMDAVNLAYAPLGGLAVAEWV